VIHYLVGADQSFKLGWFLDAWGREIADRFTLIGYQALPALRQLFPGTYIFTDFDRLSPGTLDWVADVWDALSRAQGRTRLLNHPRKALGLFELLRGLYVSGQNLFNVHRATELPEGIRFPVYVRSDSRRTLTPQVADRAELETRLAELRPQFERELLIVEHGLQPDSQGIFREYSALRIGDRIVPRQLLFSRRWPKGRADLIEPSMVEEEMEYLRTNPHRRALEEVFALAGVDYGRIDYGLVEGRVQVCGIHPNPILLRPRRYYGEARLPGREWFAAQARDAFRAIDLEAAGDPIPINESRSVA
jgi:hypothetical protein